MFRKLVSNLPFSPALVGQIGFYAKRLRKEEATRRFGLFMTVLALIVQSFTVFIPSTSANTSHASDLISGGVTSLSGLLAVYDNPNSDYKKIMTYAGITRSEIASMSKKSINSRDYGTTGDQWLSWGRVSRLSAAQGETKHTIDGSTTVYSRPLWRLDTTEWTKVHGSTYVAFVGQSAKMGKFAIILNCGNLVTTKNPPAPVKVTVCRPGVGVITILESEKKTTDLPADSDKCKPKITVCRPGVGVIDIYQSEKKTTDLPADSQECKPKVPSALCHALTITPIERTKFKFAASSKLENGATISKYTFVVRKSNASGEIVLTKTVNSTSATVETEILELKQSGDYYVSVTVATSLGDKTAPNCTGTFKVVPPEKCVVNPNLPATDAECKPCPGNPLLWYKSPECSPVITESKTATNLTQGGGNASAITAVASDRIEYKLTITNAGKVPTTVTFKEELDDVLEYATIQDNGGGTFDQAKKTLTWPSVTLVAGEKQTRTFVVALPATIPTTARGTSEPTSYDCIMNNTFGDNVQIKVQCEAPKIVEQTISELPSTGPRENMIFAVVTLAIVSFFWARSMQLGKEVRLVRKDFSASAI